MKNYHAKLKFYSNRGLSLHLSIKNSFIDGL